MDRSWPGHAWPHHFWPIHKLKRRAKRLARERGIPLHQALNQMASEHGFRSWSHLMVSAPRPVGTIHASLADGDMLLIGARPSQGKTLLALELAMAALASGAGSAFFSLNDSEADVRFRLRELGYGPGSVADRLLVDTSDEICADTIVSRLRGAREIRLAVVDYLQILDQRRATPALSEQVATLSAFARGSGAVVVALSQIDRAFDRDGAAPPSVADVRAPNPFDVSLFNKVCFLHEGRMTWGSSTARSA